MTHKDDWFLEGQKKPSLRFWIFNQMTLGAAYAALVLFGLIAFILIIRAVSFLLPENPRLAAPESRGLHTPVPFLLATGTWHRLEATPRGAFFRLEGDRS